jgi:protein dithiol oxidoreductase (disulfide-forming)
MSINRREFSVLSAGLALAAPLGALAQVRPPEDGREFRSLDKRVAVEAPAGKVEVVDFFWYGCPHCNAFEPMLQAWSAKLPDDVRLRRVPAAFRDDMVPQQRLFYALEAMGKVQELHVKVFDAIHKERVNLNTAGPMAEWLAKQGVDPAKFTEIYNSFAISAKQRRAVEIQDAYQVEGVPAFGIAGRWYSDPTMAGNQPRFVQVAEYLIDQARKSR